MLSVASLKTGQHRYYVELVSLNYYTEGGEPPGLWAGSAAREFGLEPGSKVDARHLERLCAGFDPHTGEALVQNAGKKPGDAHPPAFATFEDGYRANVIVETILASARNGSVWTKVQY